MLFFCSFFVMPLDRYYFKLLLGHPIMEILHWTISQSIRGNVKVCTIFPPTVVSVIQVPKRLFQYTV